MNKFSLEQQIVHRLLLQSPFLTDLGLLYGKMGIALCLFEYGRYTNTSVYTDMGGELLDDIGKQIHTQLPFDFDSGLSGIGWGIEYLLQNHYLEGDADDIFEEIDNKIMQTNLLRLKDHSLDTGLEGLYCYVSARLLGAHSRASDMPFDLDYLRDLSFVDPYFDMNDLRRFCSRYPLSLNSLLCGVMVDETTYRSLPLGIKDGIAGCLLNKNIRK